MSHIFWNGFERNIMIRPKFQIILFVSVHSFILVFTLSFARFWSPYTYLTFSAESKGTKKKPSKENNDVNSND